MRAHSAREKLAVFRAFFCGFLAVFRWLKNWRFLVVISWKLLQLLVVICLFSDHFPPFKGISSDSKVVVQYPYSATMRCCAVYEK